MRMSYCDSFSYQWSKFPLTQFDTYTGRYDNRYYVFENTDWTRGMIKNANLLELGCGTGKFTEVFLQLGAKVTAVDMSDAVHINYENNKSKGNLTMIKGDINDLLFNDEFDLVFCYGVLQHTPNPFSTFMKAVKYLKVDGMISCDIYRKLYIPTWWYTPKYLWRPVTTKMDKEVLMRLIKWYVPKWLPIDTVIKRVMGRFLSGLVPIPCYNYIDRGYDKTERIQHAILDTFDALAAKYDNPKTLKDVGGWNKHGLLRWFETIAGGNGVVIRGIR